MRKVVTANLKTAGPRSPKDATPAAKRKGGGDNGGDNSDDVADFTEALPNPASLNNRPRKKQKTSEKDAGDEELRKLFFLSSHRCMYFRTYLTSQHLSDLSQDGSIEPSRLDVEGSDSEAFDLECDNVGSSAGGDFPHSQAGGASTPLPRRREKGIGAMCRSSSSNSVSSHSSHSSSSSGRAGSRRPPVGGKSPRLLDPTRRENTEQIQLYAKAQG